ncbi:MAG: hypothetical protein GY723_01775 [bacterium]|nr:hypothetical protein [bacterium]MCP5065097.1 hypothetical protein [bacterium]
METAAKRGSKRSLAGAVISILWMLSMPVSAGAGPGSCRDAERFEDEPCRGRKLRPQEIEAFLARPTRSQWEAQLELGWGGSDGSTAASDRVGGVAIGATSREHADIDLPANRHDWYYELGRTFDLDGQFRKAADDAFRDMCLERIAHLSGLRGLLARSNVIGRYAILRVAGFGAWWVHPGPVMPEGSGPPRIAARDR